MWPCVGADVTGLVNALSQSRYGRRASSERCNQDSKASTAGAGRAQTVASTGAFFCRAGASQTPRNLEGAAGIPSFSMFRAFSNAKSHRSPN